MKHIAIQSTFSTYSHGNCNSITVVTRRGTSNSKEPLSVLIRRKKGEVDASDVNTNTSSTLVAYEMSRCGLGPRIYELFNGGTVEE